MIARKLTVSHVLRQVEAAELLGVSQPAISLYCRNIGAFAFSSAEVLIQISQCRRGVSDRILFSNRVSGG
jgi:predicted transcriptional regulator